MLIPLAMIIPLIYRLPYRKTTFVELINNADYPNRFSFNGHSSTFEFLM